MTVDDSDPFTSFMTTNNNSIDLFLKQVPFLNSDSPDAAPDNSHFLFSAWSSMDNVISLASAINNRLSAMSSRIQHAWSGRLLFTNGTVEQVLGLELQQTLMQWESPRNRIVSTDLNISRLDCHYTSCRWPTQTSSFSLVAAASPRYDTLIAIGNQK